MYVVLFASIMMDRALHGVLCLLLSQQAVVGCCSHSDSQMKEIIRGHAKKVLEPY